MNKNYRIIFFIFLGIAAIVECILLIETEKMAVLNPMGFIALEQRDLLVISTLLMLIVVIPVLVLTFTFIWKFRANNPKAKYDPDFNDSLLAELIWWGFPCAIIFVLSIITWKSSYDLDPFKPLESDKKPLTIQAVALQWKWLFIYPEQNIATVNYIQFPEKTPLHFEITADAPMNSFWIPQLGGQIYAMPGMKTELNLIADAQGVFRGSSAQLSGEGFAGMTFVAKSSSQEEFDQWIQALSQSKDEMNTKVYNEMVKPSENSPVSAFILKEGDLFDQIVMKYMMPSK